MWLSPLQVLFDDRWSLAVLARPFSTGYMRLFVFQLSRRESLGEVSLDRPAHPHMKSINLSRLSRQLRLAGPDDRAARALSVITAEEPTRSLHINISKILCSTAHFDGYTCIIGSGVELLGAPVPHCPDFVSRVVNQRIHKCVDSLQKFIELSLTCTYCYLCRLRVPPPPQLR